MTHSTISLGVGLGGGRSATSSGRLPSGGAFVNALSGSFDGTDDRLDVGSGLSLSGSSTVSLWFKRTGTVSLYGASLIATAPIYRAGFDNTFAIALRDGTDLTLESYDSTNGTYTNPVSAGVISTDTWYHLALVLTSTDSSTSSAQFYLDGSTTGSAINLSGRTLEGLNQGFTVASYQHSPPSGYRYFFPGEVDEVSVFNSALSSSDITSIYNSGTPADLSSLSPVGWWRMGDGTGDTDSGGGTPASGDTIGTVVDQGSGGNNATGTNGPTYSNSVPVAPFSTMSGSFDGTDDHFTVSSITLSGAKAVSLWVKFGAKIASGSGSTLIAKSLDDYFPYMAYGRYLYARGTNNSGTTGVTQFQDCGSGAFVEGEWGHVVISSDGTTMSYFFNGALKGTDPNVDPQNLTLIGGRTSHYHDSLLDEVALFNSALSASDVTAIYNNGVPADLSAYSPLHWWRFGDGTGDTDSGGGTPASGDTIGTVVDQGSGSNNATGTNGPTYSSTVPS